ncbi:MAG: S8 family serine peptidase, partial [Frankia sp.]
AGATSGHPAATIPAGAGYTGPQVRAAYGAPSGARTDGGPEPTIATLQLAGWHPADLTTYARAAGRPDPIASGRYTAIGIGRSQTYNPAVDGDGDAEVALDQETILGVAPHARQRAYFAPNTDAGFLSVLDRVRTDAALPGSKIVAFSTSWGLCERFNTPAVVRTSETLLAAMAAAGVTPLAASGDAGSGDCGDGGADVSYPASSAYAVAVGGTSLRNPTTKPSETAWIGSGGGCSRLFTRPAWQPATPCPTRAVPDIAGPADPAHGYAVYDARYWAANGGSGTPGWVGFGGTSLAAPAVAAMLADTWATRDQTIGYGEIHAVLYRAAAKTFRDATSGSNGAYQARVGYDLVTGRGSPQWSRLGPLLRPGPAAGYARAAGIGTDQAVWVLRGTTPTFTSLGGAAISAPSTVAVNSTALEIVTGTDRNLWVHSDTLGWAPLGPAGTSCSGQAAVIAAGVLHVGCRAASGSLLVGATTVYPDGAVDRLTTWTSYGGHLTGPPAAALVGGVVTWFATIGPATAANLASRTATTGWHALPARCVGAPGAGTSPDAAVSYVGCRTASGSTVWARAPFATFSDAGGREIDVPGFAVGSDGTTHLFVVGDDRGLWTKRLDPVAPAAGWSRRGGIFILGMGAARVGA